MAPKATAAGMMSSWGTIPQNETGGGSMAVFSDRAAESNGKPQGGVASDYTNPGNGASVAAAGRLDPAGLVHPKHSSGVWVVAGLGLFFWLNFKETRGKRRKRKR